MPRFRVKFGAYTPDGKKLFKAGTPDDVVDSPLDLVRKFGKEKFELIGPTVQEAAAQGFHGHPPADPQRGSPPPADTPQTRDEVEHHLKSRSLADLKAIAVEEKIDLTGCKNKEEVIARILGTEDE